MINIYKAPYYTEEELFTIEPHFPFSDKDATYVGINHQYELTDNFFQERGVNLEKILEGDSPDKVKNFLADLRRKFYTFIYTHNKSTKKQLDYLIAKKGILGYTPYEYRQQFLDAMFLEGCYLATNGDLSNVSGIDLDTMQNMSADVMRGQDRDFHKDALNMLKTLGLYYFGKYYFIPQGEDW